MLSNIFLKCTYCTVQYYNKHKNKFRIFHSVQGVGDNSGTTFRISENYEDQGEKIPNKSTLWVLSLKTPFCVGQVQQYHVCTVLVQYTVL